MSPQSYPLSLEGSLGKLRARREVVAETRVQCRGYYSGDIARLVASELVAEGIKVWR